MTECTGESLTFSTGEMRELASRADSSSLGIDLAANDVAVAKIAGSDRAVGEIVRNVSIPTDLRRRVLDQLDRRDVIQRAHQRRRSLAIAMTTIAAGVLLVAWIKPFGRPVMDGEAIADQAANVFDLVLADPASLAGGPGAVVWPVAIQPRTCVGHREVGFFGQRAHAFELASGATRAVLIVVPESRFPYQLNGQRVLVPQSTRQIDVHCFASGSQICVLIVRAGVDPKQFEAVRSIT